jgi:hypothetical protein
MKNAPSGGDGMPPSPERAKVVESTAKEDTDSCFSEKNPSGLEELQKIWNFRQHGTPHKKP